MNPGDAGDQLSLVTCGSSRTKGTHHEIATRYWLPFHASALRIAVLE